MQKVVVGMFKKQQKDQCDLNKKGGFQSGKSESSGKAEIFKYYS